MAVELFLDPDDRRPRATQLYEQLRDAINEGRLSPGDRLTPSRIVAGDLGVSRSTVTEAYGRLTAEGYVAGRSGGGSVVSAATWPTRPRSPVAALRPTLRAAATRPYSTDPDATAAYDCRPGHLDPALFPAAAWRRCVIAALDRPVNQYGDPAGTPELRSALAHWVTRSRGVAATAAELFVTAGAGHAVDLLARVLLDPGDVVAVEEPGYPVIVQLLRSQGLEVVGVPVDEHGLVVEALPAAARLVYVTPSHQYPLGMVMARHRRHELLAWARRTRAAIIEDDYDSEFRSTARPLEPLQRLDRDGRVIYVGTFAKTLSAGLRLGFLVAPPSLLPALRAVRAVIDWCPPPVTQAAMTQFVTDGHLDRHLRRTRAAYAERRRLMWDALGRHLPAGYERLPAAAGLHLTVRADTDRTDPEPTAALRERGLRVSSLSQSYAFDPPVPGFLLGFAGLPTPLVVPAVRTLGEVLAEPATVGR